MSNKRITRIPYQARMIEGEDLNYKTIREDWNLYELEDGTLIKVKLIANKISRGIDPTAGDGILRVPDSDEPFYNIRYNVVIAAEVPKKLLKLG